MALSEYHKKRLQEKILEMSDEDLIGLVEAQSQTAGFNPDVEERQMVGVQYARGTKAGRKRYEDAKALAAARLAEMGEMVDAEQQRRADLRSDEIDIRENVKQAPEVSPFAPKSVMDRDPEEAGMNLADIVERRLALQQAIADSDDPQMQRESSEIDSETAPTVRDDEDMREVSRNKGDKRAKRRARRKERKSQLPEPPEENTAIDFVGKAEPSGSPLIGTDDIKVSDPMSEPMSEPMVELSEEEAGRLFRLIMGSSFDPVSSMDKGKMEILKKAKAENPDLTDNQLALKIYRDYM